MIINNNISELDQIINTINSSKVQIEAAIKPCPFCGADGKIIVTKIKAATAPTGKRSIARVVCTNTHCCTHGRSFEINEEHPVEIAKSNAIASWNKRTKEANKPTKLLPDFEPLTDIWEGKPEIGESPKDKILSAKKCPCCGGLPKLQAFNKLSNGKMGAYVYCVNCRLRSQTFESTRPKGEDFYTLVSSTNAINYWNRRAYT